jgi:hypothetical protein
MSQLLEKVYGSEIDIRNSAANQQIAEGVTGLVNDAVQRPGKQNGAKEQQHRANQLGPGKSLRNGIHLIPP